MPGEEAWGCGIGRVAGQAPSDFLSQACSLPSYQALITDLDLMQLQPPPPPAKAPGEGSQTPSSSTPGPLGPSEALSVPRTR